MFYLIGTDEAGYGPNLGPLAVTATLWRVEDDSLEPERLFEALAPVVTAKPTGGTRGKTDAQREVVPIADSKKLHRHDTLEPLETGIFAALAVLDGEKIPETSEAFCDRICGTEHARERAEVVWNAPETERKLPRNLPRERVPKLGRALAEVLAQHGAALCGIRSELVFPERFNDAVEASGSKGVFLSDTTMKLIVHFWDEIQSQTSKEPQAENVPEVRVFCDKHGGRNFYLPTLMEFFPNLPFCVVQEGRAFSEYVHYGRHTALRIRFQAKGEALLPVALASMVSKYLREISMERFNLWWRRILPEIHPTAGYPLDAKRFREEISEKMAELGLDWRAMWRNR